MNPAFIRVIPLLMCLICTVNMASGQSVILGVLEDVPGKFAGESNSRNMRVVFQMVGAEWKAFPSNCSNQDCLNTVTSQFPEEVNWTIAFNGRSLGKLKSKSRTPTGYRFYSDIGLQDIKGQNTVPTVGKRSEEYGGYLGAEVYRPLVANSKPYFKDPVSWRSSAASTEFVKLLRRSFRRKYPKLCKLSSRDETKLEPFPYRDENMKVVKAYRSNRGWTLARLHLDRAVDCEDLSAGFDIDDAWFAVDPQKSVRFLDTGMWLVDAGDYDNDGRSELMFCIDRENAGGYELFYDDFTKHATFEFGFH